MRESKTVSGLMVIVVVPCPVTLLSVTAIVSTVVLSVVFLIVMFPVPLFTISVKARMRFWEVEIPVLLSSGERVVIVGAVVSMIIVLLAVRLVGMVKFVKVLLDWSVITPLILETLNAPVVFPVWTV